MTDKTIGMPFPELKAETLSGIEIKYPDDIKGKITLILMAFKRETQRKIDSWLEPFSKAFESDTSVQFFEIPMLAGAWKLMSPIIDGGMRSGIPKGKHGNVTTFYGNVNKYCELLGIEDKSDGYVFLLDQNGVIQWRSSSFATEENLRELFDKIESLSNPFKG
ncbi:mitochondrial ATPase complex subunit ATP10 [candidate division KSB1 bacterium]|nr:mitochondrial ATPase complex subunit ATP10 [candidate division KSB1 bacterium]